eukprot:scaffold1617_cov252-Pinguiococcus_pyrenoidosus.AAC.12
MRRAAVIGSAFGPPRRRALRLSRRGRGEKAPGEEEDPELLMIWRRFVGLCRPVAMVRCVARGLVAGLAASDGNFRRFFPAL